jgi:hypothetical protein
MPAPLLFLLALSLTALPLFLPHRRNQPGSAKPTTLLAIYRDFFAHAPLQNLRPSRLLLFLWILAAITTTLLPPFLFLLLRSAPPAAPLTRAALFVATFIALPGAAGNFVIIVLNATSFGFGTPPPIGSAFPFACIIAALHLLLAATTLTLALSPALAAHAHRLLS